MHQKCSHNHKKKMYSHFFVHRAKLKYEELFEYTNNKAKYANDKCMKRLHFKEAIEQIEAAMNGEDSAPLDVTFFRNYFFIM